MTPRVEHVPDGQQVWRPGMGTLYLCHLCLSPVVSQSARGGRPTVHCLGLDGHVLEWA